MQINEEINHALEIYRTNRFKVNSERNMDVDSHNVQQVTKKGRTLLLCDCEDETKFCKEPVVCRHKFFFIMYPLLKELDEQITEMKIKYDGAKLLIKEINPYWILNDLDELRRIKL